MRRCGREATYFNQIKSDDGPTIGLVGFDDYPLSGHFTYFTHGLHQLGKPEWVAGRPEYFVTIDNADRSFALFFAYVISAFAYEKVMGWGTLIGAGDDDAIEGYPYRRLALGPPLYLGWRNYRLEDPGMLPINLGMAYYMSDADFEAAADVGFDFLVEKLEEDPDYWRRIQRRDRG